MGEPLEHGAIDCQVPPNPYQQQGPPAGYPGAWDGVSWPPNGAPQVPSAPVPEQIGPPTQLGPGAPHVGMSVGNGGDEDAAGGDIGDQGGMGITICSSCRIHWTSLWGRVVLVNCVSTNVDLEAGAEVHVFGGSFEVGEEKGGQVVRHDGGGERAGFVPGPPGGGFVPGPPGGGFVPGPPGGGGYPPGPPAGAGYGAPPGQMMGAMPCGAAGGLDVLQQYQKVQVKQKVCLIEAGGDLAADGMGCSACGECCETVNTYTVMDMQGVKLLKVKEDSDCFCRVCCNPYHALRLRVSDPQGQVLMTIDRPFKCPGCCPAWFDCCRQEASIYAGEYRGEEKTPGMQIMGFAQQPCCGGCFSPAVNVMDRDGGDTYAVVEGPTCCFGGMSELCCDQDFPVSSSEGKSGNVAKIVKEKPETAAEVAAELMSDADLFTLTFNDPGLPLQRRAVLLGTLLLLDYMFFENDKPFDLRCEDEDCFISFTCFYWYICGFLFPCKCKCPPCGGEKDND